MITHPPLQQKTKWRSNKWQEEVGDNKNMRTAELQMDNLENGKMKKKIKNRGHPSIRALGTPCKHVRTVVEVSPCSTGLPAFQHLPRELYLLCGYQNITQRHNLPSICLQLRVDILFITQPHNIYFLIRLQGFVIFKVKFVNHYKNVYFFSNINENDIRINVLNILNHLQLICIYSNT